MSFLLFAALLADNNRLGQADTIIGAFEELMASHRGEVSCVVTSAEVSAR
jgi:F0F1-type ATP synthase delta subunit